MLLRKKILITLSILTAFAPAIQCSNLIQQRTQLEALINKADVTSFKNSFFKAASETSQDAIKPVCTHLKQYIKLRKSELQTELASIDETGIEKYTLGIGIAQTLISSFALYKGGQRLLKNIMKIDFKYEDIGGIISTTFLPSLIAGLGAFGLVKYAIPNCITGYNYRQHLEQQIANLDEIIKAIETLEK